MMLYLEILGTLVGIVYLWLEYKASIYLWIAGIVMPAIYIFVYYDAGFYADMGINIYYLLAGLFGLMMWAGRSWLPRGRKERQVKEPLRITRTPLNRYLPLAMVTATAFAVIVFILLKYTDSTVPYGDSLTTALSIVGLWMLAKKYVEQWIVWIVVDILCCGLYIYKDLWPTAILYGVYSVVAVFGYMKWIRLMKEGK